MTDRGRAVPDPGGRRASTRRSRSSCATSPGRRATARPSRCRCSTSGPRTSARRWTPCGPGSGEIIATTVTGTGTIDYATLAELTDQRGREARREGRQAGGHRAARGRSARPSPSPARRTSPCRGQRGPGAVRRGARPRACRTSRWCETLLEQLREAALGRPQGARAAAEAGRAEGASRPPAGLVVTAGADEVPLNAGGPVTRVPRSRMVVDAVPGTGTAGRVGSHEPVAHQKARGRPVPRGRLPVSPRHLTGPLLRISLSPGSGAVRTKSVIRHSLGSARVRPTLRALTHPSHLTKGVIR